MRKGVKRTTGWVAIYAVAFHTLLVGFGLAAIGARDSFDPFAITCLTGAHDTAPADSTTSPSGSEKTQICKHCVLCGVAASPATQPQVAFAIALTPAQVTGLLWPILVARPADPPRNPHLPRGPPNFA